MPYTNLTEAYTALDAVRHAIAQSPFQWALTSTKPGKTRTLTVSIGAAAMQPEWSESHFLHCADTALYAAKSNGRNRVESYTAPT